MYLFSKHGPCHIFYTLGYAVRQICHVISDILYLVHTIERGAGMTTLTPGALRDEEVLARTNFGTLSNRRIQFPAGKGWFTGGSEEEIPMDHVAAVRIDTTRRHPIIGSLILLFGLIGAATQLSGNFSGVGFLLAVLLLAIGVVWVWGSPRITVELVGGDERSALGLPWAKGEAQRFVRVARTEVLSQRDELDRIRREGSGPMIPAT
jgi:hypothetical protein